MRRPYGTGTIESYRGKHRARFAFTPGHPDVVGVYDTCEQAEDALEAVLVRLTKANGGLRGTPLRKVVEKMIAKRRAEGYASVGGEESDWKSYLAKTRLADRPVQDITQGEVLDTILSMKGRTKRNLGKPLSLSTRKKLLNIVRAALYVAKADELVPMNVLADAAFADPKGQGQRKKKARRALTWEQFLELWRVSGHAPEVAVAIWTGARQGELRALHWRDVHGVAGSACTCDEHRADPHVVIRYGRPPLATDDLDECTTKSGEPRAVSLFGLGLEVLETMHRAHGRNPKGIVFVSRLGGYRAKGRLVGRKAWSTWKAALGLPGLRWHDLRHTCGTWLVRGTLGERWPLEAVKEHLGHGEVKVTERYADQRGGSAALAMAERMRSAASGGTGSPPEAQHRIAQVWSHLRDLNSRPTVYERDDNQSSNESLGSLGGLAVGFIEAVKGGDPMMIARGLTLAEAVLELARAYPPHPMAPRGMR
jgi:integrase